MALSCGGLHQFVQDYDPITASGNGFVFYTAASAGALADSIHRVVKARRDAALWATLSERASSMDFSWASSAKSHEALYLRLLKNAGISLAA